MARRCMVTGKGVLVGHRVSHANNKSKHRFLPNIQVTSLWSEALARTVRLRLSIGGLRTIEHMGGLDAYLCSVPNVQLSQKFRNLKKRIVTSSTKKTISVEIRSF